jgi:hypothetical protein
MMLWPLHSHPLSLMMPFAEEYEKPKNEKDTINEDIV